MNITSMYMPKCLMKDDVVQMKKKWERVDL